VEEKESRTSLSKTTKDISLQGREASLIEKARGGEGKKSQIGKRSSEENEKKTEKKGKNSTGKKNFSSKEKEVCQGKERKKQSAHVFEGRGGSTPISIHVGEGKLLSISKGEESPR